LLHLLTVVSLVLVLAAGAAWVRSRQYLSMLMVWESSDKRRMAHVSTHDGDLYFHYVRWSSLGPGSGHGVRPSNLKRLVEIESGPEPFGSADVGFAGFGARAERRNWDPPQYPWVRVPLWAVMMVAAFVPVLRVAAWKRRRQMSGRCAGCGYDLRATPGRCPECGKEVAGPTTEG
jgi:hypothetical protein